MLQVAMIFMLCVTESASLLLGFGLLLPVLHARGAEGSGMVQGLQIEHSELREYTHGMLSSIADKLGKDFAPFLPHAVEAAFASCSQASHALPFFHASPCSQDQILEHVC